VPSGRSGFRRDRSGPNIGPIHPELSTQSSRVVTRSLALTGLVMLSSIPAPGQRRHGDDGRGRRAPRELAATSMSESRLRTEAPKTVWLATLSSTRRTTVVTREAPGAPFIFAVEAASGGRLTDRSPLSHQPRRRGPEVRRQPGPAPISVLNRSMATSVPSAAMTSTASAATATATSRTWRSAFPGRCST
jgi:hypothetical protein